MLNLTLAMSLCDISKGQGGPWIVFFVSVWGSAHFPPLFSPDPRLCLQRWGIRGRKWCHASPVSQQGLVRGSCFSRPPRSVWAARGADSGGAPCRECHAAGVRSQTGPLPWLAPRGAQYVFLPTTTCDVHSGAGLFLRVFGGRGLVTPSLYLFCLTHR